VFDAGDFEEMNNAIATGQPEEFFFPAQGCILSRCTAFDAIRKKMP
jgi:hypothetical protein